jgi:prolyl-tRNA editing enzyme YbaK/EbsC (Cys-tRNA(Pro) deacylase)
MMCELGIEPLFPESTQRVAVVLQSHGHLHGPVMLDHAARTAQQAADALGVGVGQIAKSIIFRQTGPTMRPCW